MSEFDEVDMQAMREYFQSEPDRCTDHDALTVWCACGYENAHAGLELGLRQSAAGETVSLGSFARFLDEPEWTEPDSEA